MYETVCNTYEATTLPLPNRVMQPRESWPASMPMFVLARGKRQLQDIFVTCTYEGVHDTTDGLEAHIALSGVVKGRGARSSLSLGKARGYARFNIEKGFLTLVHLTVRSEVENEDAGVRLLVNDQSIVRRREGNQLGIAAATRNQPGAPPTRPQPAAPPRRQPEPPQAGTGPAQPVKPTSTPLATPRPSQTPKGEELSRLLAELKSSDEAVRERSASILQQTQALKAMDAKAAEQAVLPLLRDSSVFVRCAVVKMLADVGGRESIVPLEKLAKENNLFHSGLARQALASIRNRAGIDPPTPPPTGHEPVSDAKSLGLLAYWSFEEGAGVQAADASGNALHAKLVKAGWTDGIRGKALRLSGPGSYLDYGDSPRLSFAAQASFSIAFWTRTTRPKGMLLSQRHDRDGSAVIDISIADGKAKAQVRQDGNDVLGPTEVVSGTISNGEWHHLVLTREGDQIELFLDGVSQGRKSGNLSGGAITTNLRTLGAELYWLSHFAFGDPHFEGDMDEFCIFDRVLKANEIAALALR